MWLVQKSTKNPTTEITKEHILTGIFLCYQFPQFSIVLQVVQTLTNCGRSLSRQSRTKLFGHLSHLFSSEIVICRVLPLAIKSSLFACITLLNSFRVNPANSSWFTNRSAIRLLFRTYTEISLIVHSASIYRWNCWNCSDESKRIAIICCMFDEDQTLVQSFVTGFTSFIWSFIRWTKSERIAFNSSDILVV